MTAESPHFRLTGLVIVTCGWCPDAKARTEELTRRGFLVSHTVCPSCLPKLRASFGLAPERKAA